MKTKARIAGIGGLAFAAAAIAVPASASAAVAHPSAKARGQVFVQTDNLAGNTVVAYDRAANGSLAQAGVYATGGLGGQLVGSVVDHTASEGALALDRAHGLLYAVNAGSDTISVFAVHGDTLQRRQILGSGGSFPVSIAVHGDLVYVLNARDGGSVQGYRWIGGSLVRVPAWNRALGLDDTVTPEFTHTPGQIAFTPDGSQLLVTTKAAANTIDVFAINASGGLSATPVINDDAGAVPFGLAFDPQWARRGRRGGHQRRGDVRSRPQGRADPDRARRDRTGRDLLDRRHRFEALRLQRRQRQRVRLQGPRLGRPGVARHTGDRRSTVDASASSDGANLYVQAGAAGIVDAFRIGAGGVLTAVGSVTVPGAAGGEGIAAS